MPAMKPIIKILAATLFLAITGFSPGLIAQGDSCSDLGTFIVEKSKSPLIYDARILKTYDIMYENSDLTVRVGIDETSKKCKKYIVVSGDFAIQYICTKNIFGAEIIEECYVEDGIPATDSRLNRSEYFRQKVLTQIPKSEMDHVMLISVYFPKLLSEDILMAKK